MMLLVFFLSNKIGSCMELRQIKRSNRSSAYYIHLRNWSVILLNHAAH